MALPQTVTETVDFAGSFVVNVIVAPSAPAAVGSTVTVKFWLPPPGTDVALFGLTTTDAFDGVTDGALSVNVEAPPALVIVIVAECVTAPAAATDAGDRFGAGQLAAGDVTVAVGGMTQTLPPGG